MAHSAAGRVLLGVAIAFGVSFGAPAREMTRPASPLGLWLTKSGNGVIEIAWCGQALCGSIVGIKRAPGEPMPQDYQGRSQCGLAIITGERPTGDGNWLGHVTDPRDGKEYQAEIRVDDEDRLHLRGFVGIPLLGQTEIWHRFSGHLASDCEMT
jgi:uncharacterized protein (DUF2147 family)